MVAAVSLGEVIRFASDMNALGQEANISEDRFAALTSTMGGYEEVMQGMRRATMGVVDDMHIQQNAMLLIQSAGIDTSKELENMTNMIMRLKKPSEDASTAINNFSLMLANNSILRLDSFGLSASKVRERILELMESGEALDRSQAFRMAVLEQGAEAVARFGDAADAAGTSFSRLGTIVENVKQDFGQGLNIGVEASAGILEMALGIHPAQIAEAERRTKEAVTSLSEDTMTIFRKIMNEWEFNAGQSGFIGSFIQNSLVLAQADPALAQDIDNFTITVFERMRKSGAANVGDLFGVGGMETLQGLTSQILKIQDFQIEIRTQTERTANATSRAAEEAEKRWQAEAKTERILAQQNSWQDRIHAKAQEMLAAQRQMESDRSFMMGSMGELVDQGISMRTINPQSEFMNELQAERVRTLAREAEQLVEAMEAADEANDAMFTDEQLERAKTQADYVADLADSAQEAAEAFANISLDEALGRGDGGMLGQMTDEIVKDLEAMQATADEIKRIQREFDLASGRESETGAIWQDRVSDIIAGVARNISTDQAIFMAKRFEEMMKDASLRGIDTNNPEFAAAVEGQFATLNFNPDFSGLLDQFDPAKQAAQDMQTATTDTASEAEKVDISMQKAAMSSAELSTYMDGTRVAAGGVANHLTVADEKLTNMTSKAHVVRIQTEWVNPNSLLQLLLPGLFGIVQAAGGITPGTNQTASTSGDMTRRR